MSWTLVFPVIVALLVAIVWLWIVRVKAPREFWAACNTMVSILVSVIVGLGIGFGVFQWEQELERGAERENSLQLINQELGVIEMDLHINGRDTLQLKDTAIVVNLTVLPSSVILRAGTSGVFTNVQSWRMLALDAQIDKHNTHIVYLMGLLAQSSDSPGSESRIRNAHRRISAKQENILQNCSLLRTELGIEKNKYAENMISKYKR